MDKKLLFGIWAHDGPSGSAQCFEMRVYRGVSRLHGNASSG